MAPNTTISWPVKPVVTSTLRVETSASTVSTGRLRSGVIAGGRAAAASARGGPCVRWTLREPSAAVGCRVRRAGRAHDGASDGEQNGQRSALRRRRIRRLPAAGRWSRSRAGRAISSQPMRRQTSSTSAASRKRSCSPFRRAPATTPNCAPMTPPTISSSASTTSTRLVLHGLQQRGRRHHEHDLEQRGADHDAGRHAQQIDHGRHHDEAAADAHDGCHEADEGADHEPAGWR